ncbi:hypothetical protein HBB16_11740 [Pseudonocardia sp. MCCB 268]|nr:hypothetical protein [Pseudonocardia cytotoxica]
MRLEEVVNQLTSRRWKRSCSSTRSQTRTGRRAHDGDLTPDPHCKLATLGWVIRRHRAGPRDLPADHAVRDGARRGRRKRVHAVTPTPWSRRRTSRFTTSRGSG